MVTKQDILKFTKEEIVDAILAGHRLDKEEFLSKLESQRGLNLADENLRLHHEVVNALDELQQFHQALVKKYGENFTLADMNDEQLQYHIELYENLDKARKNAELSDKKLQKLWEVEHENSQRNVDGNHDGERL
ncbi:MAG: hypothetical protein J6C53_01920 [Clostridia bacterium]|nr:hypothetical protein [Clostridia bacterium]